MILLPDGSTPVAVSNKFVYVGTAFTAYGGSHSQQLSGALANWSDGTNYLLLVGLQNSGNGSYSYGYRELGLGTSTSSFINGNLYIPGEVVALDHPDTSIDPDYRSNAEVGKYPIMALYTATGSSSGDAAGRPVIFASTMMDGLWSYRAHNGEPQWNGEDK
jgi:hypothetical protein